MDGYKHLGGDSGMLLAVNQQLAAVAAANGGPFTNSEARSCGYTKKMIRVQLESGRWTVLRRGVYVEPHVLRAAQADPAQGHALEVAAALLALETDAVGSHQSAARVHGLSLLTAGGPVSLMRPRGAGSTKTVPRDVRVRTASLPPGHVCRRHGVMITTVARSVVDLARTVPFRQGVVAADSALRSSEVGSAELRAALAYCRGWPGSKRAAEVVAFADALAESVLESLARVMCAEHGLPPPQTQVVLGDAFGPIGRVDLYWAEYGVVGEADGMGKYGGRHVLVAEKQRQERLENAGFHVVRFTWDDVLRYPEQTVARIRAAFARASGKVAA